MKKIALLGLLIAPLCFGITSFELPWMNAEVPGTLYKSSDHPDGIFVIETYFLKCPYCHQNAPNVDALASKYSHEPRVQVLDVGVDRHDSQYEQWIAQHQPNHPVLKDANRRLISQLGTQGYPSTYVIDGRTGRVVYSTSGVWNNSKTSAIENAINQLLSDEE